MLKGNSFSSLRAMTENALSHLSFDQNFVLGIHYVCPCHILKILSRIFFFHYFQIFFIKFK